MSIKQKTIKGFKWSFIDSFVNQFLQFVIGIILARLLSPNEFGLIGIITIFISISQSFIEGGFRVALIRKNDCSNADFSTVFYFNLIIGIILYIIIFFSADYIAFFFQEPLLSLLIKILSLSIIINSLSIIQSIILTKRIDFKLQAKISIISSILSGLLGIWMAYVGFGVWSLIWKTLSGYFLTTILLWLWNKWRADFIFSKKSFKKLFGFGSKLLASSLLDTVYHQIYNLIIGKFFSFIELGFFTRAVQYANFPSLTITAVVNQVSLPVLSEMQDDNEKLKNGYKHIIKNTMFITFCCMFALAATAKSFVLVLIGEKWLPIVPYLQLLCFSKALFPLHALNLSMLSLKGRSDLYLTLEIIKKLIIIPVIFIGIYYGIKAMLIGTIVTSIISFFLNSIWSGKLINYSFKEQIRDLLPSLFLTLFMGFIVALSGLYLSFIPILVLIIQLIICAIIIISLSMFFRIEAFFELKTILVNIITKKTT